MRLTDPVTNSPFETRASRIPGWVASPLARLATREARAAARRKDWTAAAQAYVRALRLTPGKGRLWVQLGHAYGQLGMVDAAQIAYLNASNAEPDLATGHRHLGYVRRGTQLHEQGMRSLARAFLLDPADREIADLIWADRGEAGAQASLARAALTHADERRSPASLGFRGTMLRSRARKAARRRDWKEAETLYKALAQSQPGNADAFLQLGHALNEQNRPQDAETAYRQAIACEPLYVEPWLHLGYVLTAQNQHLMAREAFATVLKLAPDRVDSHPILAGAEIALTRTELAHLPMPANDGSSRAMLCPPDLSEREKAIWNLLATHIQGRH